MRGLAFALISLFCAAPAGAELPSLRLPLQCTLGETCFIQQYVDRDPGPGASDYLCRGLTYDTHRGTDFRLVFRRDIHDPGVAVVAAERGTVRAVRNDMADIAQNDEDAPDVSGKECGNGIVLDHTDGWSTQYCHLRKGSVAVRVGQELEAGQLIGRVGLSGMTEFPHLHFKLMLNDLVVDPFDPGDAADCMSSTNLWADKLPYQPGGLLAAGFDEEPLEFAAIRAGKERPEALSTSGDALVFWAYFFGLEKGDKIDIAIFAPDGQEFARQIHTVDRHRAEAYRLIGKARREQLFTPGIYSGQVILRRDGEVLDRKIRKIRLE